MNKLNTTIYRKLLICAEEAKEQGMVKLAENIKEAIGPEPATELEVYSYAQVEKDVHSELWKAAMHLARYWNVEAIDVMKLDNSILVWASELIDEVENSLGVDVASKSSLEPKVPGQDK
jgi:hypothetical protein